MSEIKHYSELRETMTEEQKRRSANKFCKLCQRPKLEDSGEECPEDGVFSCFECMGIDVGAGES